MLGIRRKWSNKGLLETGTDGNRLGRFYLADLETGSVYGSLC